MKPTITRANRRLGKLIRTRRISLGLSRDQLAKGSLLSLAVLNQMERGEGLNLDTLVMVSKALKISLANLFKEAEL